MTTDRELQAVLDALPDPCAIVDARLDLQLASASLADWLDVDVAAAVGRPLAGCVHADSWQKLGAGAREVLDGRRTQFRQRVQTGADVHRAPPTVLCTITRLAPKNDATTDARCLVRFEDDAELRRRLLQLRVTERALHAAASGIVICDARERDMPMTYVNAAFEQLTGYKASEVLGRNCRMLNEHDREQPALREVRDALADRRETTVVLRNFKKDGTPFWNELTLSPITDRGGLVTHFVGIIDDITDRMEFAAERERLLAEAMAQKESAARATKARDTLLAVVSHELRSPLNGIRLWTSLLHDEDDVGEELLRRAVAQIEEGVATQSRIIEDLLDVSRFESGRLELRRQRQDLVAIVREIVQRNQPAADSRGLKLTLAQPPKHAPVIADRQRIEQVLQNLLDNAMKFTEAEGKITVTVRTHQQNVHVAVRDTGRGIEADKIGAVFDQYWQASGRDARTHGGLGLGLNLVKRIVELHDGAVTAESDGAGRGSTLSFRLPLRGRSARDRATAPNRRVAAEAVTGDLLVVDDDAGTLEAVALGLRMRGYEVRMAPDVDAALTAIGERPPRALISDLMMGRRSGFELCRALRDGEFARGAPRIPAIAISGRGRDEDERDAWLAGFDLYLTKPVGMKMLGEQLERLLAADAVAPPANVLVVDPDRQRSERVRRHLIGHGHSVQVASSAANAMALLDAQPPDVIVAVRRVGDGSGRDLLDSVHREDDEILTLLADGDDEDDAGSHVPVRLDDLDEIVRQLYRWQSPTRFEG